MVEFTGGLRETVAVEHWRAAVGGDAGAGSWTSDGPAWAALVPLDSTLLADIGERQLGRPRFRLTLRAPSPAGLTSRFRWRGRTLVVVRAEPDPRLRDRVTFLVEDRT